VRAYEERESNFRAHTRLGGRASDAFGSRAGGDCDACEYMATCVSRVCRWSILSIVESRLQVLMQGDLFIPT